MSEVNMRRFIVVLIIGSLLTMIGANSCTSRGGTCLDWRYNVCPAGYETGICPGDSNVRCCLPCGQTCQSNEESYKNSDGNCFVAGGHCQHNTNYCSGTYTVGKCGGPASRQCCESSGNACTAKGGICQDWTRNICTAGYERGICPGNSNIRCCLACSPTCHSNEDQYDNNDGQCNAVGGNCQHNTNYCSGIYTVGKCGGPASRQCCQKSSSGAGGECPRIISRSEWGARAPKGKSSIGNNLPYQFVHHSAGSTCNSVSSCSSVVRSIQNYHMNSRNWADIGYSFLVGGDGNIYEGRGWNVQGAHTSGYNTVGYGTCFIGNFMNVQPTQAAIDAYLKFLDCAVAKGKVSTSYKLYGHRQAGSTSCPGNSLYTVLKNWPHWRSGSPSK